MIGFKHYEKSWTGMNVFSIPEQYEFTPERNEYVPTRNENISDRYWNQEFGESKTTKNKNFFKE